MIRSRSAVTSLMVIRSSFWKWFHSVLISRPVYGFVLTALESDPTAEDVPLILPIIDGATDGAGVVALGADFVVEAGDAGSASGVADPLVIREKNLLID